MNSKRAIRRHHRRRMIERAARMISHQWGRDCRIDHFAPRIADNMKVCSCRSCGNQRRHFGEVTAQEKSAEISEREQRQHAA